MEEALIRYENVELYQEEQLVLKDINLNIGRGEFIYLVGEVGSGKSSLLKSIYAEIPVQGDKAQVLEFDLKKIKSKKIPYLRRKLGVVFQDFQLLMDRTVDENLRFVLRATGWKQKDKIDEQIETVLRQVGMSNKGYKMPHELSGGEQQRVVIARALLNSPEIIIADEPTGNLDPHTGTQILKLLYDISKQGTTVIMATHNHKWCEDFPGQILCCEGGVLMS